jgi:O-acetylserine/cysteine efflux transporter
MNPERPPLSLRDTLLALLVMMVWGANFVAIKIGVDSVPPLLLTGLRFVFTALPALVFLRRPAAPWHLIALFGFLLGVVKFGMVFSAVKLGMPAGLTSLLMQLQVFFTLGLAALVFGERPSRIQALGAAIAFCGIGFFIAERVQGALPMLPFLMVIGAAFAWGCANMAIKKAGRVDTLAFLVWSSLFSPLPLFLLSYLVDGPAAITAALAPPRLDAVLALAFIVGPSTLFAFAMWNGLLTRYPTSQVAPFALLVPVFGILSGALLLDEPFTGLAMLGSGIVFAGLLINVLGDRLAVRLRRSRAMVAPE